MKLYTFDLTLAVSITVEGENRHEAMRFVREPLQDCALIHVLEDGLVELAGEATIVGEPSLTQIDGKDVK